MTSGLDVEYAGASSARGPLLVVEGAEGIGWEEVGEVRLDSGEVRHGIVLDVHRDWAVVEVFEGTAGLRLDRVRVSFSGSPMRIPVGDSWLGRVCNGRGEPLDGGPPVLSREQKEVSGRPINPATRETPRDAILTGISAIDGLATLVRGQKLPIFSLGGLPHLELAAQLAAQARVAEEEPFAVVFAAVGVTHADAAGVRDILEERAALGDIVLFVNTVEDPLVERLVTPRIALTVAEHLAFDRGRHVLVVIADMTSYCEAVREVAAARGEVPSRRGYPGYLYSDLASLYERAGRVRGRTGSLTQLPVVTMPAGDITHPVPDLTGYITEGQLVLDQELHARGVYPPFDALGSLSRVMRLGAGPGRTRDDHLEIAAQLYAFLARARQVADLAEIIGADALGKGERLYLDFAEAFRRDFLTQGRAEGRSLSETLERAWRVASVLPRRELSMVSRSALEAHYEAQEEGHDAAANAGR
jgi:V/A-type H+-transporting ATPase subunit B